eukprot:5542292-Alexandrium_andersonii.AAC.1
MDDGVLCEPALGVRPWLSEAAYLEGMRRCLGPKALNVKKDELEGQFSVRQLVWGGWRRAPGAPAVLRLRRDADPPGGGAASPRERGLLQGGPAGLASRAGRDLRPPAPEPPRRRAGLPPGRAGGGRAGLRGVLGQPGACASAAGPAGAVELDLHQLLGGHPRAGRVAGAAGHGGEAGLARRGRHAAGRRGGR